MGTAPGEFMGPHALAFDSQGRLFVADRSNNRVQIFDRNMKFVDEWRHFGRPSGIAILKDDTLIVADSESSQSSAVRHRRLRAAATSCAIPGGATASGSAARRTVRSATTFRARVPKVWARTTRATSSRADGQLRCEPVGRMSAEVGQEVNHSNSRLPPLDYARGDLSDSRRPKSNSQATGQIGSWEWKVCV